MEAFFQKALKTLGQDHAEVLVLGWYNKPPSKRILDRAVAMKEKGRVRAQEQPADGRGLKDAGSGPS